MALAFVSGVSPVDSTSTSQASLEGAEDVGTADHDDGADEFDMSAAMEAPRRRGTMAPPAAVRSRRREYRKSS